MRKHLPLILVSLLFFFDMNSLGDPHPGANTVQLSGQKNQLVINQSKSSYISLSFALGKHFFSEMLSGRNQPERSGWQQIDLPGTYPINREGYPHLPVVSRYLAIPNGSKVVLNYTISGSITQRDVVIGPVAEPRSTAAEDTTSITYLPNQAVFGKDALYPQEPVAISEIHTIRGVQVVELSVFPFQYNPVRHELIAHNELNITIDFVGGSNSYGDDRLRSRWLDPMLQSGLLNGEMLPDIDYESRLNEQMKSRSIGAEYLIIRPNGVDFQRWADTIKKFRQEMGITTKVVPLSEIGGNNQTMIKNYITNAYYTWDIPPVAVLLLGDHGTDANSRITSFILSNHPYDGSSYGADNQYVDISNNNNPDMVIARITARNASELEATIRKFMTHEYNPPMFASFYNPTSCLGWENNSWFQVAAENLSGYFQYFRGRTPNRIYTVYSGNPSAGSWQTFQSQVDYWGPAGLGYLTAVPNPAYNWYNGNSTKINNAINNGTFLIQHHDHGYTNGTGWHRPYYTTGQISGLSNTTYPFMMSFNCSSGKFTNEGCFSDDILRLRNGVQGHGVLGIIASSSVSYFYSNENMCWGVYDYLWPDFRPDQQQMTGHLLLPAFGAMSSKLFSGVGALTNNLYHHFGDAFLTLYDTIPRNPVITHQTVVHPANQTFIFQAEEGLTITLSRNGEILAAKVSDNSFDFLNFGATLEDGDRLVITASSKRNIKPYRTEIVVDQSLPFPEIVEISFVDEGINANNQFDYNESPYLNLKIANLGLNDASGFSAKIIACDSMLIVQDSTAILPAMPGQEEVWVDSLFQLAVKPEVSDNHTAWIAMLIEKTDTVFFHQISFPIFSALAKTVKKGPETGIAGNWDNYWEAGEQAHFPVKVENLATSTIPDLKLSIRGGDEMIQLIDSVHYFHSLKNDSAQYETIRVFAQPECPVGHQTQLFVKATETATQISWYDTLNVRLTKEALIVDLDGANSSATALLQALEDNGIDATVTGQLNENLHHYKMAFVCLGTYPNAHVLTQNEGRLLEDFLLQSNGKLYLEGAETWCYDPQTAVYPLFGIQCIDDGVSNSLGTISSNNQLFTTPLVYNFNGDNQFVDQIDSLHAKNSQVLLKNVLNNHRFNTAVFRNAERYRTIGASHEFGGLAEAENTRKQLMAVYLELFGIETKAQWIGHTPEWFDPANWSSGMIPNQNAIITIPSSPLFGSYPNLFIQDTIRVRSLIIEENVHIVIPETKVLIIDKSAY